VPGPKAAAIVGLRGAVVAVVAAMVDVAIVGERGAVVAVVAVVAVAVAVGATGVLFKDAHNR